MLTFMILNLRMWQHPDILNFKQEVGPGQVGLHQHACDLPGILFGTKAHRLEAAVTVWRRQ